MSTIENILLTHLISSNLDFRTQMKYFWVTDFEFYRLILIAFNFALSLINSTPLIHSFTDWDGPNFLFKSVLFWREDNFFFVIWVCLSRTIQPIFLSLTRFFKERRKKTVRCYQTNFIEYTDTFWTKYIVENLGKKHTQIVE